MPFLGRFRGQDARLIWAQSSVAQGWEVTKPCAAGRMNSWRDIREPSVSASSLASARYIRYMHAQAATEASLGTAPPQTICSTEANLTQVGQQGLPQIWLRYYHRLLAHGPRSSPPLKLKTTSTSRGSCRNSRSSSVMMAISAFASDVATDPMAESK